MSNQESIGIASIALGLLIVIGVVRGTWKKVFADLGFSGPGVQANTGLTPQVASQTQQSGTQTQQVAQLQHNAQVMGSGNPYVFQS